MNKVEISFTSHCENISFARSCTQAFLVNLDCSLGFLNELKTIVSEGVTNAIVHGYQGEEDKRVYLSIGYDSDSIYIEIRDEGIGISDIDAAREPLYTSLSGERSGLGFTIMEVFSDTFEVVSEVDKGTTLIISKKRE